METARNLAKAIGAKIQLLHVNDLGVNASGTAEDCKELFAEHSAHANATLSQKVRDLKNEGIEVEALAVDGIPSEVILREAEHADLLVVGKHWKQKWRLFSRNTVEAILQASPCPVVIAGTNPNATHIGQGSVAEDRSTIRD